MAEEPKKPLSEPFDEAASSWNELVEAYNILHKKKKQGLSTEEEDRFKRLREQVLSQLSLKRVRRGDTDLLGKIANKDPVHKHGQHDVEELLEFRVGSDDAKKRVFAIVDPDGNTHAVVYTHWSNLLQEDSSIDYRYAPGNVDKILRERADNGTAENANVVVCYSIGGVSGEGYTRARGSGELLIRKILEEMQGRDGVHVVTLSPLRTFGGWLEGESIDQSDLSDDELRKQALIYLALHSTLDKSEHNPVLAFHLGNGAVIGDIKLNANIPGSEDAEKGANVMITYVYPLNPDERRKNRDMYRQGRISELLSGHLMEEAAVLSLVQDDSGPGPSQG